MKFGIIDATAGSMTRWECETLDEARALARMNENVDHGCIRPASQDGDGISIVVYEFGLYAPVDQIKFFSIGQKLFAGNAVLYGCDLLGETVDLPRIELGIEYYADVMEVARRIARGTVTRPALSINGSIKWRWPHPGPESVMKLMRERDGYK